MKTIYPVTPVPAPRQSRRDKWKPRKCVINYRNFKDQVRANGIDIRNGDMVVFRLPMPKSWSQAKKAKHLLRPHAQRPDVDNLLKALLDACFEEDSHIHTISVSKIWDMHGGILVSR